jgi:threonine/homoserine/homoserine lactone efflux protein
MAMLTFLGMGIILGLSAGFAPGPLLALVISETLQYNLRAGLKVALAPLITDLPIVLVVFLVLRQLQDFAPILGIVALGGSLFLLTLAWQNLTLSSPAISLTPLPERPWRKGILANFLSPHPYLFWLSVGGPTLSRALEVHALAAVFFVVGFYCCLVGAKLMLAWMTGRSKGFIRGRWYRWIMRVLGLLLVVLAGLLGYEGLQLLLEGA